MKTIKSILMIEEEKSKKLINWDLSIVIALIAVLISTLTAYISYQESKIMMAQQKMLSSQQEASVWPFLENKAHNTYRGDTMVIFKYVVKNKGIGPAIIDTVMYKFDGENMDSWKFDKVLRKKYGDKVKIQQTQNSALDKIVLAPGETHIVITEMLARLHDTVNISHIADEMNELYRLEYCYCSVYGKCWFVSAWDKIEPSESCEFRKEVR